MIKYSQAFAPEYKRSARSAGPTHGVLAFIGLLMLSGQSLGQISIDGITDRGVYANSVSFTINSQPGFEYTAQLNDIPVAVDVPIQINQPEYYELNVQRKDLSSALEETRSVQFIIRASERGNSEWGLPLWVPYPSIDSAGAEFSNANLKIVAPAEYPMALDIPLIVRIEDDSGNRLGVNGTVSIGSSQDDRLQLLRGVGFVILPAALQPGIVSCTGQIHSLQTPKQIAIEQSTVWQTVSADITDTTEWPANSRIHISGAAGDLLTIAPQATLTIGAGSIVMIDPDIEIAVNGSLIVNGTADQPVVFTAVDRDTPWGGLLFESSSSRGDFKNVILTAGGADPDWFDNNSGHGSSHRKNQCLFYLSNGARVTLTDCYMVDNDGQIGHGEDSYLTMTGCLMQKCVTVGQYNGGEVNFSDCQLIEFPSAADPFADADNDGIYLTDGVHVLTDCLIGWALDDGIDAGGSSGNSVTIENCWFESCFHEAIAWSGSKAASVKDSVFINCAQGIECGYNDPVVTTVRSLCTGNLVGARFGDNYDWTYNGFLTVTDSLLIFNHRDVWGRAWDDWTVHLSQMDIHDNYLAKPNENFPENFAWDPQDNPEQLAQLAPFLPTAAETVGIALAVNENSLTLDELSDEIPVRLSTFTTKPVSVDYIVTVDNTTYNSGSLQFAPGETVKHIQLTIDPAEGIKKVQLSLTNPTNAELTGYRQLTWQAPRDSLLPLIVEGNQWRYFKGTQEPPADWNQLTFDDSDDTVWLRGETPIGYETGSGLQDCLATSLTDMKGSYLSVYARRTFTVENPALVKTLTLEIKYDDGYIAYINGAQVHSRYPPDPVAHDEEATTNNHEARCDDPPEQFDLTAKLVPGINVLALQAHNTSLGSSDFVFIPALSCLVGPQPGDFEPDGDIDLHDLAILAAAWSTIDGQPAYNPLCDMNTPPDGKINMLDLLLFAENWLLGL